jgi:peptide chain release factor 1
MRIEIRPGEGGADAVAFARELAHAFTRISTNAGSHARANTTNPRLVVVDVADAADPTLRRFAGVHRIQRTTRNDRNRRHTSTVTVVVLGAATCDDVRLDDADLSESFVRSSGPGGQHRNKSHTGVRLVHIPTGITAEATESRSQHRNRTVARERLMARLTAARTHEHATERNAHRRETADPASPPARTWTWTFWRDTVSCDTTGERHRIADVMRGRLRTG